MNHMMSQTIHSSGESRKFRNRTLSSRNQTSISVNGDTSRE
ncbi:hypothetical protein X975_10036, partial [Stegodyphus mimosarum]